MSVGDSIPLVNGQIVPLLRAFKSCVNVGITDFVIPVIKCAPCNIGTCNHQGEVTGFATISVTAVETTGSPKTMTFRQICNNSAPGNGGSGGTRCFGSGNARLVDDRTAG